MPLKKRGPRPGGAPESPASGTAGTAPPAESQSATPMHRPSESSASSSAPSSSSLGKRAMATAIQGAKLKRINWGKGEPLERLTKAVEDWDAKTGPHFEADKTMSLLQYSNLVGIHYQTLSDYASRSSASLSRINLVCWRSLCRLPQRRPLQRRPPQVRRPPQCRQPWCRQPRRRPSLTPDAPADDDDAYDKACCNQD